MTECPKHGDMCAHTGAEFDRCPWCHRLWSVIISTLRHSCEQSSVWRHEGSGGQEQRVREAAAMRLRAAGGPYRLPSALPGAGVADGADKLPEPLCAVPA